MDAHSNDFDFDVRELRRGETVEVFLEPERRWCRAVFDISTAGLAFIELPNHRQLRLEQALLMGMRRSPRGRPPARA